MKKSKEVQGLLIKVAELETLLILLIGMLQAQGTLSSKEVTSIFEVAEIPEILLARIKLIKEQGASLMEARKRFLSEKLGIESLPEEEPILEKGVGVERDT